MKYPFLFSQNGYRPKGKPKREKSQYLSFSLNLNLFFSLINFSQQRKVVKSKDTCPSLKAQGVTHVLFMHARCHNTIMPCVALLVRHVSRVPRPKL